MTQPDAGSAPPEQPVGRAADAFVVLQKIACLSGGWLTTDAKLIALEQIDEMVRAALAGPVAPQPERVYVVELDDSLHAIFATQEAADGYCQSRRVPSDYQVVKWKVQAK